MISQKRPELTSSRLAAFTLIELLVVISIIALLLALTVPAVQQTRESARKTQCTNNLRQIVLACDNFESANRHYPTSRLFDEFGSGPNSTAWSFLSALLPYLDQTALYTEGGVPDKTLVESGVADATIPVFLCPSDPGSHTGPRWDAGNMVGFGVAVGQTNYKGVCGANWGADETQGWNDPADSGTMWPNIGTNDSYDGLNQGDGMLLRIDQTRPRRKADVRDGLSNTFLLGEDLPEYDIYCSWPYANNVHSTCAIPPNYNEHPDPTDWPNIQSFRSQHASGLHFAMADGSVRFVDETIDLELYRGLATIAGEEVVTLP